MLAGDDRQGDQVDDLVAADEPSLEDVDDLLPSSGLGPLSQWGFVVAGVLGVLGISWVFRGSGRSRSGSNDDRDYDSYRSYDSGSSSDSGSSGSSSGGGGDW